MNTETAGTPTAEPSAVVNGTHTTNGLPHGSTSLSPHLVVTPAADAIVFYRDVLGARVVDVTTFPGAETVAHAVLDFGTGVMTLSDPLEAYGLIAPDITHGHCYSLAMYVPNVDEVTEAAQRAGATLREAPATFVSGDRFSSVLDPFGVRWSIMTRVEDLSDEESKRRVAEWAATQGVPEGKL